MGVLIAVAIGLFMSIVYTDIHRGNAESQLKTEGITEIEFNSSVSEKLSCPKEYSFRTLFRGESDKGKEVSGVVCSGWLSNYRVILSTSAKEKK